MNQQVIFVTLINKSIQMSKVLHKTLEDTVSSQGIQLKGQRNRRGRKEFYNM